MSEGRSAEAMVLVTFAETKAARKPAKQAAKD